MDIKRGDIWYIESGFTTGSEQRPGRPAVVVSNDRNNEHSSTIEVVYLTTQPKRDLPTHAVIRSMSRESIAICEQVTTVAIERLGNYRGQVTADEMADIEAAMRVSLGLEPCEAVEPEPVEDDAECPPPAGNQARGGTGAVRRTSRDVRCPAEPAHQGQLNTEARAA